MPGWFYNLGITGLRAQLVAGEPKALLIKYVFPKSPADGHVKIGDLIVGACGQMFKEKHRNLKPDDKPGSANKPIKVFILAGQSNMEGQGFIKADPKRNEGKGSLEHLTKDPATAAMFKHLLAKDGKWAVRDDVWIHYLDRKGKLTVGYGAKEDRIGPELGFGHVVGEAYEEPVLLIKLAWGGKSLGKDFRPPSSGGEVGPYYKEIVKRTKDVLSDLKKQFPEFGDRGYELAGFGWHQGWNDRVNQAFNDEYEKNMANFIRDIRKDLGVKKLPFVIAETGMSRQGGEAPPGVVPDEGPGGRGGVRGVQGERRVRRYTCVLARRRTCRRPDRDTTGTPTPKLTTSLARRWGTR